MSLENHLLFFFVAIIKKEFNDNLFEERRKKENERYLFMQTHIIHFHKA